MLRARSCTALGLLGSRGLIPLSCFLVVNLGMASCVIIPPNQSLPDGDSTDVSSDSTQDSGTDFVDDAGSGDIGGVPLPAACTRDPDPFATQALDHGTPDARVLYSWTTASQEAALRETPLLLTVGEIPELGKGIAMDALSAAAAVEGAPALDVAVNGIFAKFRYAWPNPWATRRGWPGEDYGDRLVRMVLRENAWIGRLSEDGTITSVYDLDGNDVPLDEATAAPERIAALYFVRERGNGISCGGSFQGGSGGYREFIVGNEAMLEEWSLGTTTIIERLEQDVAALETYVDELAECTPADNGTFNSDVVCSWGSFTETYRDSLAIPSEYYVPNRPNIVHLIELLQADLFTPDPLVVKPEQP